MKHLLASVAILLATFTSFAQAPNRISYQAEVRNGSNTLVVNQLVGIRISILQGSITGTAVYTETHTPTTNANGLVSLQIGGGTTTGNFATINWGSGPYFLKTETDPAGGTNYSITGTNQLLSVPYALFSNTAGNGISSGTAVNQMIYWNGTTWVNTVPPVTQGQVLTYCDGALTWTVGGVCPGTITALNCATATNTGTLVQGAAAAGVSSSVPYTGGNGGPYNGQTVASTGVTGLTATLAAGTFANGAGSLTYTITGTPATSGTAGFALSIGGQSCILTRTVAVGTITALSCSTATNSGTLAKGIAAATVESIVPYTGGNGGTYAAQTVISTGVTGLTATLAAGTFASGAGSLTYKITGTPANRGTASFALSVGGQSCTLNRTVLPVGTMTALSCSTATNNGTLTQGIAATGVSSIVPYTGGNGGYRSAQIITSTGVTGLKATCAAVTLANGSGTLTYTITGTPATSGTASFALSVGGQSCTLTRTVLPVGTITALSCSTATNTGTLTENIPATSVSSSVPYTGGNGGTYTDQSITSTGVTGLTATLAAGTLLSGAGSLTYTITGTPATGGTASFALSIGGQSCTLTRTVKFCESVATAIVDVTNPATGKIWMDRNLGASQAATSSTDVDAYGDLYQWGRRSDGHQCRTSATTSTLSSSDQPSHGSFILAPNAFDWRSPENGNLWQGVNGVNNPCPIGYRLPTEAELDAERTSWSQNSSSEGAYASPLKLPVAGFRSRNGSLFDVGSNGYYWSSTVIGASARNLTFGSSGANMSNDGRAYGFSVRCLKD